MLSYFYKADSDYGMRLAKVAKADLQRVRQMASQLEALQLRSRAPRLIEPGVGLDRGPLNCQACRLIYRESRSAWPRAKRSPNDDPEYRR